MTEEQLAKLAVAREKALVVRRQQKVEKLKAEAVRLEATQVGSKEETEQNDPADRIDRPSSRRGTVFGR